MKSPRTTRQVLSRLRAQTTALGAVGLCVYLAGVYLCAGSLLKAIYYNEWSGPADVFTFSAALSTEGRPLMIGGTIVVVCAVFARILLGRCQLCAKRLDRLFFCSGKPWAISPALQVCPYCRGSLDALPTTP